MSSYGDGNNYRGTSCKDSEVTTYKMPWPENEEAERLKQRISQLEAQNTQLRRLLARYRNETPLGHQPHMIAHEVDKALEPPR